MAAEEEGRHWVAVEEEELLRSAAEEAVMPMLRLRLDLEHRLLGLGLLELRSIVDTGQHSYHGQFVNSRFLGSWELTWRSRHMQHMDRHRRSTERIERHSRLHLLPGC